MSSTASTSGVKFSMFGAKSGFVIPKNKLSGSLVPTFQSGKTQGDGNAGNKHNTKQGQRKTKWGPDLTQDAAVKKGKALAYEKRVEQIKQLLESGTLEVETSRASALASQNAAERSLESQNSNEMVEHLELEMRDAIGEILKLNPRYKAPPDYKPLMKEARVPIPVKEHRDFNFLNFIFGSQGETQKRLEKETGAKVQIFGAKTGGEKVEISPSDGDEIQIAAWEELYFKISAETYEKVDAAIAVIEVLITSVSGNVEVAATAASAPGLRDSDVPNNNSTATDVGAGNQTCDSTQIQQSQIQQYGPQFPVATNQTPVYPLDSSALSLSNPILGQEQAVRSFNQTPFLGQHPSPVPQHTYPAAQSTMQVSRAPELFSVDHSGHPSTFPVPGPQASLAQPGFLGPPPFPRYQVETIGSHYTMRQSAPSTLQPGPSIPHRPRPLMDVVSNNMDQVGRPPAPNFRPHHHTAHQSGIEQPPFSFSSSIPVNHMAEYPSGRSMHQVPVSVPALTPMAGRPPAPVPISNILSFPSINPPNAPPRPLQVDFTFQPQQLTTVHTPQIPSRPNLHPAPQFPRPPFQSPAGNLDPQSFMQGFSRPQHLGRSIDQPSSVQLPRLFHGNPRSPNFQNFGPPMSHMRPANVFQGAHFPDLAAPVPPRPVFGRQNLMPGGRPQNHQRPFNSGRHQVYDPFSPSDA